MVWPEEAASPGQIPFLWRVPHPFAICANEWGPCIPPVTESENRTSLNLYRSLLKVHPHPARLPEKRSTKAARLPLLRTVDESSLALRARIFFNNCQACSSPPISVRVRYNPLIR